MYRPLATLVLLGATGCVAPEGVDFRRSITHAVVAEGGAFAAPALTVSAWVWLEHAIVPQVFVNRGARNEHFTLYLYRDGVRMLVGRGPDAYASVAAPPPELRRWTHYVGTFDGRRLAIYRDGRCRAERPWSGGSGGPVTAPLLLGAEAPAHNGVLGRLRDVCIYGAALTAAQVAELAAGGQPAAPLLGAWSGVREDRWIDRSRHRRDARLVRQVATRQADGYRGIWYSNQPSGDQYAFKYAGGFATYPQQHVPVAVHAAAAGKTFFVYGAAGPDGGLLHAVGCFDHATGQLSRPTILLDKHTGDAHDNPVLSLDPAGYLWVFSPSHGRARPAFIHRSRRPHDIGAFERVRADNFSYPQPWYLPGFGFCFLHTLYDGRRSLYCQRSSDGFAWGARRLLASFGQGHYQVSWRHGSRVATAFNYHPRKGGLNARTNLYYMASTDGGRTWCDVRGRQLALPLRQPDNPARIADYESQGLLVYLKDLQFDERGRPVIVYLTSRGYRAGPANDPRTWRVRWFDGERWHDHPITTSDHNYDFGSIYLEAPDRWRLFAPTAPGPQPYNTGGELVVWRSGDRGAHWIRERQLTRGSRFNHGYLRRPLDAHPDFYGLWADGHGRQPSASALYYTTSAGEVRRLR